MPHPDDGRVRRRRFLTVTASVPALAGLHNAAAGSAPTPTGAPRDVRAYGAVGDGSAGMLIASEHNRIGHETDSDTGRRPPARPPDSDP